VQGLIQEIRNRQHIPLLVGGTMMYINALRQGLDNLPTTDPAIRSQIDEQAQAIGWPAMHQELAKVDPDTASRLSPNDSQRIGRALLVYRMTGTPLSRMFGRDQLYAPVPGLRLISLEPSERKQLHARIEKRFDAMLELGLLQEVQALYDRGDLSPDLPSIRCVGYRQMWEVIAGRQSLDQAREKAIAATRQLAKRQLTWLRSMNDRIVLDSLDPALEEKVRQILLG